VQKGDKTTTISCTHLLVAAGRFPQSSSLHLEQTGITLGEKGRIPVNDRLETSVPGIYALGDVNGGPAFTHIAYHDYLIVCKNLLEAPRSPPGTVCCLTAYTRIRNWAG